MDISIQRLPMVNRLSDKAARNMERAYRLKARTVTGHPSGPYRAIGSENDLMTVQRSGIDTLAKMFKNVTTRYSLRHCLGTRQVLSEEEEFQSNGRILQKVWHTDTFYVVLFFGLFFCETPYDRSHNICLPSIMYSLQSSLPSLQLLINCTPFNFTQYSSSLCWSQFSSQSAHLQQWQHSNQDQSKYTKVIRLVSQWKSCSYRSPADGTSWMHYKKLKLTHRQTHLLFLQFTGIWRILGLQNYSEFDMFHFLIVWNGLGWVAVKLLSPLECL